MIIHHQHSEPADMQDEKIPGEIQLSLYLIPFSEVFDIQATFHNGPGDVPSQNERELAA